jgi:nitrite reductase/ring-hydroxylating ferredoxin subunit
MVKQIADLPPSDSVESEDYLLNYQRLLDRDRFPVPDVLRMTGTNMPATVEIPTEWYLSREIHEREVERIWKRTWQAACREEDIPSIGDTWVYDVAGMSIIIVRSAAAEIRAFFNSCLHRGRPLRDYPGCVKELQCSYHGFTWNLDGTFKTAPCLQEFEINPAKFRLPEVKVGTWAGYVFINPDPQCEPLEGFLGGIRSQFTRWPLEQRYKAIHVAKEMPANWKLVQEAFMESYHAITTHPQFLPAMDDKGSQYDAFENFSRAISPVGVQSPHLKKKLTNQAVFNAASGAWDDEEPLVQLGENDDPRVLLAEMARRTHRPALGDSLDSYCDSEMIDAIFYTVFPNLHPWGGLGGLLTYRFRPLDERPDKSLMEVIMLYPFSGERPAAARVHRLAEGDSWFEAPEILTLANVLEQDTHNLTNLQRGVANNPRKRVVFSRHQELKIRHWYDLYQRWMGLGTSAGA